MAAGWQEAGVWTNIADRPRDVPQRDRLTRLTSHYLHPTRFASNPSLPSLSHSQPSSPARRAPILMAKDPPLA